MQLAAVSHHLLYAAYSLTICQPSSVDCATIQGARALPDKTGYEIHRFVFADTFTAMSLIYAARRHQSDECATYIASQHHAAPYV